MQEQDNKLPLSDYVGDEEPYPYVYSFRGEFLGDASRFFDHMAKARLRMQIIHMETNQQYEPYLEFRSPATLDKIMRVLDDMPDSHVMQETLRTCSLEDNDLKRTYSGYKEGLTQVPAQTGLKYDWKGYEPHVAKELDKIVRFLDNLDAWSLFLYARARMIWYTAHKNGMDAETARYVLNLEPHQATRIFQMTQVERQANRAMIVPKKHQTKPNDE